MHLRGRSVFPYSWLWGFETEISRNAFLPISAFVWDVFSGEESGDFDPLDVVFRDDLSGD